MHIVRRLVGTSKVYILNTKVLKDQAEEDTHELRVNCCWQHTGGMMLTADVRIDDVCYAILMPLIEKRSRLILSVALSAAVNFLTRR